MRTRSCFRNLLSLTITCATFLILAVPGVRPDACAAPVLTGINPQAALPGGALTVTGQSLGNLGGWTAVVELQSGEKFEQPVEVVNATQFKFKAPMVYTGYNVTPKIAQHRARIMQLKMIYIKQATTVSNKLPFNIISPYPILDSPDNTTQTVGTSMIVQGGNWDKGAIYAPNMYWANFEYLPGKSVKAPILLPNPMVPPIPIIMQPNMALVSNFMVQIPDVYAGKSESEKQAISNYTGKLTIYGITGPSFPSNPLNIKIKQKQTQQQSNIPNPYNLTLSESYAPGAPNRTMYYKGTSSIVLPAPSVAKIGSVKNTSSYRIQLSYKDYMGGNAVNGVWLDPNQSTGAFNGKPARGNWEALGPESGSFSGQHHIVKIGISWQ